MTRPEDISERAWEAAYKASFRGDWAVVEAVARAIDAEVKRATAAERQRHEEHEMALYSKIQALAPHGTCGCSYDAPEDFCDHHSPKLIAAKAEQREADAKVAETHFPQPNANDAASGTNNGKTANIVHSAGKHIAQAIRSTNV